MVHVLDAAVVAEAAGECVKKGSVATLMSSTRRCHDTRIWWALLNKVYFNSYRTELSENARKKKRHNWSTVCQQLGVSLYSTKKAPWVFFWGAVV